MYFSLILVTLISYEPGKVKAITRFSLRHVPADRIGFELLLSEVE